MTKICIIGKGSIGARHARIFKKLGCEIYFLRSFKNLKNYQLNFNFYELNNFKNIENLNFDLIVISNPSSLHVKTFEKYIKFSKNFFIEKPISTDFKSLKKFISLTKKNNCNIYSGYFLRFNSNIIKLKEIIKKNPKQIKNSSFVWHTHMPSWHEGEDYKKSYASNKKLGGGVLLTCSHEIDLALYLFGSVDEVFCYELKSSTKINAESAVMIFLKHKNKIVSQIRLDFLSKTYERYVEVFFDNSNIVLDFNKDYLIHKTNKNTNKIKVKKFKKIENDYISQDKFILKNLTKNFKKSNLNEIINTEKIIHYLKSSLKTKNVVKIR